MPKRNGDLWVIGTLMPFSLSLAGQIGSKVPNRSEPASFTCVPVNLASLG